MTLYRNDDIELINEMINKLAIKWQNLQESGLNDLDIYVNHDAKIRIVQYSISGNNIIFVLLLKCIISDNFYLILIEKK
jgi:hypothetical protein